MRTAGVCQAVLHLLQLVVAVTEHGDRRARGLLGGLGGKRAREAERLHQRAEFAVPVRRDGQVDFVEVAEEAAGQARGFGNLQHVQEGPVRVDGAQVNVAVHGQFAFEPAPGGRHEVGRKDREEGICAIDVVFDTFDEPTVRLRSLPGATAKAVSVEPVGDLASDAAILTA